MNAAVPLRPARWTFALFVGLCFAYLLLPSLIVVPMSFSNQSYLSFPPTGFSLRWYEGLAGNDAWRAAAANSFLIGVPAAATAVVLGTLAALAAERGALRWAAVGTALIVAPMMLPHVILAIGLYPVLLDLGLLHGYLGAVIGHAVIGLPLVFVSVSATLRNYSPALELAAMTCGADRLRSFIHITFPMIRMGVLGGGVLAFAASFDELMLSLFLTNTGTRTLPRLIWEQLNDFLTPAIAAVATLVFAFSLVLLGALAVFGRTQRAMPASLTLATAETAAHG
ncbi:MAG TPA: ABC transporter permease [Stellaceae bacterium]|nr:ABC transporter permease [Stellaceae bacterium]